MKQEVIQKQDIHPQQQTINRTGIPTQMKLDFERRSGLSFDDVRVHYNSDKPARIGALAYTQGNQVHIGPGQERHLKHELGHVVQQKRGLVQPTTWINGLPVNESPWLEHMANQGLSLVRNFYPASVSSQKITLNNSVMLSKKHVTPAFFLQSTYKLKNPFPVLQRKPINKEEATHMILSGTAGIPYIQKFMMKNYLEVNHITGKEGNQGALLICPLNMRLKIPAIPKPPATRRNALQNYSSCYRAMTLEEFQHLMREGTMEQLASYQGLSQSEDYSKNYLNETQPYLVEFLFPVDPLQFLVGNSSANYKSESKMLSVGLGQANTKDKTKGKPDAISVFNQLLTSGDLYWQLIMCYVKLDIS